MVMKTIADLYPDAAPPPPPKPAAVDKPKPKKMTLEELRASLVGEPDLLRILEAKPNARR
jgi:hypothetical protein